MDRNPAVSARKRLAGLLRIPFPAGGGEPARQVDRPAGGRSSLVSRISRAVHGPAVLLDGRAHGVAWCLSAGILGEVVSEIPTVEVDVSYKSTSVDSVGGTQFDRPAQKELCESPLGGLVTRLPSFGSVETRWPNSVSRFCVPRPTGRNRKRVAVYDTLDDCRYHLRNLSARFARTSPSGGSRIIALLLHLQARGVEWLALVIGKP